VREQLEHDRVIRLLQAKYKRKFEVAINPGHVQAMPVGIGPAAWYPDLVLQSTERGRKLMGVVEVETVESVNNLEAMSQWVALARLRAPFHLYIPLVSIDSARRFCQDHQVVVAELWSYAAMGDQMRFALVQRSPAAAAAAAKAAKAQSASPVVKSPVKGRAAPGRSSKAGARRGAAVAPVSARKPVRARATAAKAKSLVSRPVVAKVVPRPVATKASLPVKRR
jgi:hypothetical protein